MTTSLPSDRLSVREKLFYGFGDLGSCIFWNSFMFNVLLYYTDVFGISASAAGWIFLISKFWDAVNDPLVGMLADRTRTRWGRYRPFLLWFSVPLCIAAVLMFTTPDFGPAAKLAWAWVTYNLVMTLYTLVNIPYTALLGTISASARERATVSTYKFACAFTGGIIVSLTFMKMTRALGNGDPQHGWQMAFLVISALALPFFLLCFLGTRERVTPVTTARTPFRQDLKDLFSNRAWVVIVAVTMAWVFFVAVRSTTVNHYLKYFMDAREVSFFGTRSWQFEDLQAWFRTSGDIASVIGVILAGLFIRRVDKKKYFLFWFTASLVFTVWPFWIGREQVEVLLWTNILYSFSSAPLCVLIWAMYADAAEFSEWKTGRQAAGLVFSASTFAQQLGWGFGPALVGWTLDGFGFQANVDQSPEVLRVLVMMVSFVPCVFGILSMVAMTFYPLDDGRVHEMSEELKRRRAVAFEPPESAAGTAQT